MVRIGALLMVFGVGSLLLPMLDFQFTLMRIFDDYQPVAGLGIGALGLVLIVLGMRGSAPAAAPAMPATAPAAGPAAAAPVDAAPPSA